MVAGQVGIWIHYTWVCVAARGVMEETACILKVATRPKYDTDRGDFWEKFRRVPVLRMRNTDIHSSGLSCGWRSSRRQNTRRLRLIPAPDGWVAMTSPRLPACAVRTNSSPRRDHVGYSNHCAALHRRCFIQATCIDAICPDINATESCVCPSRRLYYPLWESDLNDCTFNECFQKYYPGTLSRCTVCIAARSQRSMLILLHRSRCRPHSSKQILLHTLLYFGLGCFIRSPQYER